MFYNHYQYFSYKEIDENNVSAVNRNFGEIKYATCNNAKDRRHLRRFNENRFPCREQGKWCKEGDP